MLFATGWSNCKFEIKPKNPDPEVIISFKKGEISKLTYADILDQYDITTTDE